MARSDSIKNKTDEEIVDFLSVNPCHSHEIFVKVVDIFGNDRTKVAEVNI